MFDIHLETIRDFGKYFFSNDESSETGVNKDFDFSKVNHDSLEKECSELLDNSDDAI